MPSTESWPEARTAPRLDRLDRHVGRSIVRVQGHASGQRIAYSLEQALRLFQLPGESEGRLYCFRSVTLSGLPARADLKVWTDSVQKRFGSLAASAVLGTTPGALSAEAIYFHNAQQALETLLGLALRSAAATPWFSASLLGLSAEAGRATHILAIVERLSQPPMPPGAAPQILLSALDDADPVPLLAAIPEPTLRAWLGAWESPSRQQATLPPLQLGSQPRAAVTQAAHHFGWRDPHTLWLCAQCVLALAPAAAAAGTALSRARATLRALEEADTAPRTIAASLPRRHLPPNADPSPLRRPLIFDDDRQDAPHRPDPQRSAAVQPVHLSGALSPIPSVTADSPPARPETQPPQQSISADDSALQPALQIPSLLGEPTRAGGLYFLLAVLRHLGIARAIERCPALQQAGLPEHILRRIAATCAIPPDDAALTYLQPAPHVSFLDSGLLNQVDPSGIWPVNLPLMPALKLDGTALLRLWTLALRRWCWRMGRLTPAAIVLRPGRVWIVRAELDVTLPLEAADVRIRRLGLDIDPGWLPWFGPFGTVARFHYRDRESGMSS